MDSRKTEKKCFRKRRRSSDKSEDEDEKCPAVQETKLVQKLRERPRGVSHVGLATGKVLPATNAIIIDNDPFKVKTGGFVDMKKLKTQNLSISTDAVDSDKIGTEFAAETNQRDEDAQMLKYVEEELARRRGVPLETKGSEAANQKRSKDPEAVLYELPDYLRVESSLRKTEDMLSNQMLSGIPEVDLGIAAKIRNIEATEDAKQKLMKERLEKREDVSAFVPSNVAVNFMQHNRYSLTESRSARRAAEAAAAKPEKPKAQPLRVGDVPADK